MPSSFVKWSGITIFSSILLIILVFTNFFASFYPEWFANEWKTVFESFLPANLVNHSFMVATVIFTIIITVIVGLPLYAWVNHTFVHDNTAMGKHGNRLSMEMRGKMDRISKYLKEEILDLDKRLNWRTTDFIPLQAEVEMRTTNGRKRSLNDLLSAIQKSDDRLFLVIGEPGSGKSVALRKLCQDLYDETPKTGKLPIYINLKNCNITWDFANYTTALSNFKAFAKAKTLESIPQNESLAAHYDEWYEQGRLYFILDSFDEIPAIMSSENMRQTIDNLSKVLYDFLKGTRNEASKGVLASRFYKKPEGNFDKHSVLEVRPFADVKIRQVLGESLSTQIFTAHTELVPLVGNPLLVNLLKVYHKKENRLPNNQADLFQSFFDTCFKKTENSLLWQEITLERVAVLTTKIAEKALESSEVAIADLMTGNHDIMTAIDLLEQAKIILYNRNQGSVSFLHRRFCEYFAAVGWHSANGWQNYDSILSDDKSRDALVLYTCFIPALLQMKKPQKSLHFVGSIFKPAIR